MPQVGGERRRAPRYRIVAPVQLKDGSVGKTLNMSTCGVFLQTDQSYALGEMIGFSVLIKESIVHCRGAVVRVEPQDGPRGIAVELDRYEFT